MAGLHDVWGEGMVGDKDEVPRVVLPSTPVMVVDRRRGDGGVAAEGEGGEGRDGLGSGELRLRTARSKRRSGRKRPRQITMNDLQDELQFLTVESCGLKNKLSSLTGDERAEIGLSRESSTIRRALRRAHLNLHELYGALEKARSNGQEMSAWSDPEVFSTSSKRSTPELLSPRLRRGHNLDLSTTLI